MLILIGLIKKELNKKSHGVSVAFFLFNYKI